MGKWYVIANIPNVFERDVLNPTETYEPPRRDISIQNLNFMIRILKEVNPIIQKHIF